MEFDEWKSSNPLRIWRESFDKTIYHAKVAVIIGVSTMSIQLWESGGTCPTLDNMEKIGKLLGQSGEKVGKDWQKWYDKRPTVIEKN